MFTSNNSIEAMLCIVSVWDLRHLRCIWAPSIECLPRGSPPRRNLCSGSIQFWTGGHFSARSERSFCWVHRVSVVGVWTRFRKIGNWWLWWSNREALPLPILTCLEAADALCLGSSMSQSGRKSLALAYIQISYIPSWRWSWHLISNHLRRSLS